LNHEVIFENQFSTHDARRHGGKVRDHAVKALPYPRVVALTEQNEMFISPVHLNHENVSVSVALNPCGRNRSRLIVFA
jgi:hypothetical protein